MRLMAPKAKFPTAYVLLSLEVASTNLRRDGIERVDCSREESLDGSQRKLF